MSNYAVFKDGRWRLVRTDRVSARMHDIASQLVEEYPGYGVLFMCGRRCVGGRRVPNQRGAIKIKLPGAGK